MSSRPKWYEPEPSPSPWLDVLVGIMIALVLLLIAVGPAHSVETCWAPRVAGESPGKGLIFPRQGECIRMGFYAITKTCEEYKEEGKRAECYEQIPRQVQCIEVPCPSPTTTTTLPSREVPA